MDRKEQAAEHKSETSLVVSEDTTMAHANDCNKGAEEEVIEPTGEVSPNVEDNGGNDQNDSPSSEAQVAGPVTESSPNHEETLSIELVNSTEDSVTMAVQGSFQEDQSALTSALAAFEVKDVRREGGCVNFVVGTPEEGREQLVKEIKTVLEEACRVEARQREIRASTKAVSVDPNKTAAEDVVRLEGELSAKGATRPASMTERRRAREARKLSQVNSHQGSGDALPAPRNPSRSASMAMKAREALGQSGQGGPSQTQERVGEVAMGASLDDAMIAPAAAIRAESTSSYDTEKGLSIAGSDAPRRRVSEDSTPGAYYAPGRAFGLAPEWDRSSEMQPGCQETAYHPQPPCPVMDSTTLSPSVMSSAVEAFKVDEEVTEENVRQRILEEAVEADVIDQSEVTKRRRYRRLIFFAVVIVLVGIAIGLGVALSTKPNKVLVTEAPSMAPSMSPTETPRPTLEKVKSRGFVRCGTSADLRGLYTFNKDTNEHEGFNVDLCRAVAAAAIGDSNSYETLSISGNGRFKALHNDSIDVLARSTTHTMSREVLEVTTGTGFSFSVPFLYSGLVFKGLPQFVECAEELDTFFGICGQLKICVNKDSSLEEIMDTLFPSSFIHRSELVIETFVEGTCNVVATEPVYSDESIFGKLGYAGPLESGTIPFSREPLALVTRRNDPEWSDLVNAVLQALMAAEVQEVTQVTAASFRSSPELGNFREGMFSDAIAAVGNYGEMFNRHLDGIIARTGLNSLNLNVSSGLLYAFPFGAVEELGPGPIQGNTLQTILDRGYLRCGLSSDITGFAEFNATSQEWTGLDVSFCRVVAAALFADEIDELRGNFGLSAEKFAAEIDATTIEFVSLSAADQYGTLASAGIDVLAGGMASLVNEVLEPTSSTGFSFSLPYFYGSPDGNLSDASTRSLVTRQDDNQWSTFVYWTLMSTIFAEEKVIDRNKAHLMPYVNLFGASLAHMFKAVVATHGNYGDIYESALEAHIPRAGRNQLNSDGNHGPQQYPYAFP